MTAKEKAKSHYKAGEKFKNEGALAKAIDEFRKALSVDASFADAYRLLGETFYVAWKPDEAIENYLQAITIDPKNADNFYGLGEALYSIRKYGDAIEAFQVAADLFSLGTSEKRVDAFNSLGSAYFVIGRYDDAISSFENAIQCGKRYPYAYHNLASLFWKQGNYQDALQKWEEAYKLYETGKAEAKSNRWIGHFINYGNMLHEVFRDLRKAEKIYKEGLDLDKNNVGLWIGLLNLYLDLRHEEPKERERAHREAHKSYRKVAALLNPVLDRSAHIEPILMMEEVYLKMKDYAKAEELLLDALKKDKEAEAIGYTRSAKPHADLGVLWMHQKRYRKAISSFDEAIKIDPDDLSLRANRAEACLKAKLFDEAEAGFLHVLDITPGHVESRIGLGELYTALGDAGEVDMYDVAITQFTEALKLARQQKGSKRLKKKEIAAVLYSRAYATVKLYEASKILKDQTPLYLARDDFRISFYNDPDQYKAKRALEKIDKLLPRMVTQRLMERWGPSLIFLFSLAVFCITQLGLILHILDKTELVDINHYMALTFGSLILMVTGLYLPQIIKLKIIGMELEKSAVDQATTLSTLGISKIT